MIAVAVNLGFYSFYQFDVGCDFGNRPFACDQRRARFGGAGRTTNDPHDFVQIGNRDDKAKQQMRAFAGLVKLKLGPAGNDFFTETNEGFDDVAQVQNLGATTANGEHIGRKA